MLRKNKIIIGLFILIAYLIIPLSAEAKLFQTQFIKFEIPDNWSCEKVKRAWICKSSIKKEAQQAFYVLAAKALGPEDTKKNLVRQLSNPKSIKTKENTPVFSIILDKGDKNINNKVWFSSSHMNSEILDYKSTYYSSLTTSLSLLFSMHVNKNYLIKFQKSFKITEQSLQLKNFHLKKALTRTASDANNEYNSFEPVDLKRKKKLPLIPIASGIMALLAGFILYKSFT